MNQIDLNSLGDKWLSAKKQRMQNLLKIAFPDEALYREIMLSLGYPKNKINFLELALMLPYFEIRKLEDRETIEKALLYRGGFINERDGLPSDFDFSLRMSKTKWEYGGIRPANFPEKRIKGISYLLVTSISDGITNLFYTRIKSQVNGSNPKTALKNIMDFEGIGIQRKEEMFFNIVLPFFMVFTEDVECKKFLNFLFENHPPLQENSLIKLFAKKYPEKTITSTKEHMGAIFIMKHQS
jgi:hypothetical protein